MASTCFFRRLFRQYRNILFHVHRQTLNELKPKQRILKRTLILGAVAATELKKDEDTFQLQVPDPSTLTTEYLVRNAASLTLDSACTLLSQTTIALSDASREYIKCMFVLIKLLEYKLQILGNTDEENKVWDFILEAKSNMAEAKRKKMNMEMLLTTVQNLVTSSAEAAFLAGAEHSSNTGSERLYNSERYLKDVTYTIQQVELQLNETEVKTIEGETKHAEEKERLEKHDKENYESENIEITKINNNEGGDDNIERQSDEGDRI